MNACPRPLFATTPRPELNAPQDSSTAYNTTALFDAIHALPHNYDRTTVYPAPDAVEATAAALGALGCHGIHTGPGAVSFYHPVHQA